MPGLAARSFALLVSLLPAFTGCAALNGTVSLDGPRGASLPSGEAGRGAASGATEGGNPTSRYDHLPPYPDAPSDPWASVAADQPRRLDAAAAEGWTVRSTDFACTAAHDHCVTADSWLIEDDSSARRSPSGHSVGVAFGFGPDGLLEPSNSQRSAGRPTQDYTAYRTVPATRKNLTPGALVAVLPFPETHLHRGGDVFKTTWYLGVVERVDWELGFVYLVKRDGPFWISGARAAVLAWRPGGKVEIVGGRARGELAVDKRDVVLPQPQ
jgi:hypothetical protein